MKEGGRTLWLAQRLRLALLAVGIGASGIVVLGGLMGKSTAWSGFEGGGG